MKKETQNRIDNSVREVFEPYYDRHLSDAEVCEIRTNLIAYVEWLVEVGGRIYRETGRLPEIEDGSSDIGRKV